MNFTCTRYTCFNGTVYIYKNSLVCVVLHLLVKLLLVCCVLMIERARERLCCVSGCVKPAHSLTYSLNHVEAAAHLPG